MSDFVEGLRLMRLLVRLFGIGSDGHKHVARERVVSPNRVLAAQRYA